MSCGKAALYDFLDLSNTIDGLVITEMTWQTFSLFEIVNYQKEAVIKENREMVWTRDPFAIMDDVVVIISNILTVFHGPFHSSHSN